ncbi:shikimate dehydrogenase family protein [Streptomyces sp. NPDC001404]|uniref:shikimate dehydrogenase family protein n=1 Tax=Streptomyces sp. NPDC001404 TaxID=3364571 RepID=UPI003684B6A4
MTLAMPLKRAAVPLLDTVSATVRATGTANTVVVRDGWLLGENTDVYGMHRALCDAAVTGADSACVLGAGATAATALAVLRTLNCPEATVIVRDTARSGELLAAAERLGIAVRLRPWAQAARCLTADLVISALPPGAADQLASVWPSAVGNALLDVVYRPWPTQLADAARRAGATVVGGLPMLVQQAARQVELRTGCTPAPIAAIRAAAVKVTALDVHLGGVGTGTGETAALLSHRLGADARCSLLIECEVGLLHPIIPGHAGRWSSRTLTPRPGTSDHSRTHGTVRGHPSQI